MQPAPPPGARPSAAFDFMGAAASAREYKVTNRAALAAGCNSCACDGFEAEAGNGSACARCGHASHAHNRLGSSTRHLGVGAGLPAVDTYQSAAPTAVPDFVGSLNANSPSPRDGSSLDPDSIASLIGRARRLTAAFKFTPPTRRSTAISAVPVMLSAACGAAGCSCQGFQAAPQASPHNPGTCTRSGCLHHASKHNRMR